MGKNVLINESILSSIGNILRSKLSTNISYTTSTMIEGINNIDTLWLNAMYYSKPILKNVLYNYSSRHSDYQILKYCNYDYELYDKYVTSLTNILSSDTYTYVPQIIFKASKVTFPNCSYIGDNAFSSCSNLYYISLPNCSYIGSSAFRGCTSLTNSNIQDILNTYKSYSTVINMGVFNGCKGITSLDLTGYTSIGNSAFAGCTNLSYISVPNCSYIGDNAFAYCTSLSSISLPNCSYIGSSAFRGCTSLTNSCVQDILNTYKSYSTVINSAVFSNCIGITSLDLTGYTSIGDYTFNNCYNLSSISLPNCSYIGSNAFYYCSNLSYISLPNCSYIGSSAFAYCSSLTNSCVQDILNTYKSYSNVINNGVFFGCSGITLLDLTGYTSISTSAFNYCTNLTSISLPNCSYIGNYAFTYCYSLSSISLPNCSYIGDGAFSGCNNLIYISLPNISNIGSDAFNYCTRLPNSCVQDILNTYKSYSTWIKYRVFNKCMGIISLDLTGYTSIGNYTFFNCTNLIYISIPNCSYIGGYAFAYCSNLSYISPIPNCSYIADHAFQSCHNLSYVSLSNCSYIGSSAFQNCSKLESIYILSTKVPSLPYSNTFYSTPLFKSTYLGHFGSIYVLSSLVNSFKTAKNWSLYSARITAYTGT